MELELPNTPHSFTRLKSIIQEVEIEICFMQNLERKTFYATKSLGSHINSLFQKYIACISYNIFYSNTFAIVYVVHTQGRAVLLMESELVSVSKIKSALFYFFNVPNEELNFQNQSIKINFLILNI